MDSVYAKALGLAVALVALNLFFGSVPAFPADVGVGVDINLAPGEPPPLRHEMIPPPPVGRAERVVWVHGHWQWGRDRHHWDWVPGHYVERPRREAMWVDGHWDHRGGGWVWVEGEWH